MVLEGLAIGSAAYSAYSSWKSGKAQAAAARAQARAIEMQKKELRRRFEINKQLEYKQLDKTLGAKSVAMASMGRADSGEALSMEAIANTLDNIRTQREEMEYNVKTAGMEQAALGRAARDQESAGKRQAFGSLLSSGAAYASSSSGEKRIGQFKEWMNKG
jgi:hypothetical protein